MAMIGPAGIMWLLEVQSAVVGEREKSQNIVMWTQTHGLRRIEKARKFHQRLGRQAPCPIN